MTQRAAIRKMMHLDLDAFYCAVEELKNPALKNKVFAVGGRPDKRGVISTCSYAARAKGLHSAMPMASAVKLAPDLLILPPDFSAYTAASNQVMAILHNLSPLVEQVSVDEAFIEVSDLPQDPAEIAAGLQRRIRAETKLPCSLGVASNKLVAKIANDYGKGKRRGSDYPNAITVVQPGEEANFLAPLPVRMMLGVGKKTEICLQQMKLVTIGQLADANPDFVKRHLGNHGNELQRCARGMYDSPIELEREVKSVSNETTFEQDVSDREILLRTLQRLSDKVGYRLRAARRTAGTIRLKLRWADFSVITRQTTLSQPANLNSVIYKTVCEMFQKEWKRGRKVRLMGVCGSSLQPAGNQISLFPSEQNIREARLLSALDSLREKYGTSVIQRGSQVCVDCLDDED